MNHFYSFDLGQKNDQKKEAKGRVIFVLYSLKLHGHNSLRKWLSSFYARPDTLTDLANDIKHDWYLLDA